MKLSITGPFLQTLLQASSDNPKVPQQLATQLLSSIDPNAMAAYLLTKDAAVSLLADRLRANPVRTINDIQKMPGREAQAPKYKAPRSERKKSKISAKPHRTRSSGKRRRLSVTETKRIKQQVISYLEQNESATRRELCAAASLKTPAVYRRIMSELQEEGTVVSQGTKSKTVYSLFSA